MLRSPIKYYGGKSTMLEEILGRFPKEYSVYCEGFGGGGSVLFAKECKGVEIYNDLDDSVYNLFKIISSDKFEEFSKRITLLGYHRKIFEDCLNKLNSNTFDDDVDKAVCYFYVNRCRFQGCGAFYINKNPRRDMSTSVSAYLSVVDGLKDVHNRLSRVGFENLDIFDFINKYDSEKTFFYLDPPYVPSTRVSKKVYNCEMTEEEHVKFCDTVLKIKGMCLISGYDNKIYDVLVENGFHKYSFTSGAAWSDKIETLWWNYDLENGLNGKSKEESKEELLLI